MNLTPEEVAAMQARHLAEHDQWLTGLRENPEFSRGGYALSGDPSKGRAMHVDTGNGKPHCTACGIRIFGDENWLPNRCPVTEDERHLYPNAEKAAMDRLQQAVARVTNDPID